MSDWRHRGQRADRRADRRRRRAWTIGAVVAGVLVLVVGGAAATTLLSSDGDAEVATTPAARRTPATTSAPASTTSVTTVPGLPCRGGLEPDAPLRLWIAGDSIAYSVGNGLGKKAASTGVVAPVYESRVASGLSTPTFFDWPNRVAQELPRLNPEVVVFVMGTNDWAVPQATPVDGSGQPAWKAQYRAKVQSMVDALTANGRTLYWVGPPVLRDPKQEAGVRDLAGVIRSVVDAAPAAEFFDLHDLLDADDGSYTATVDADGKKVQVRAGDGVHLTPDGADYVGEALFTKLDAQCRLKAQAVANSRQQVVETQGSTSVGAGATATAPPAATTPPTVAATTPPATTPPTTTAAPGTTAPTQGTTPAPPTTTHT